MSISLEQLSAQMRRGEQVPLRHTMQVVLTLSIPSILQQIVVTAVEYIDAAMVGHIGASATASIGIVSSSTWLMHGMLAQKSKGIDNGCILTVCLLARIPNSYHQKFLILHLAC